MYCSSTMLSIESTSIGSSRSRLISHNAATALRSEVLLGSRMWISCRRFGHAPAIVGMRFTYVDDVKPSLVLVLAVDFVQAHGPITKRRSGVGAEDEAYRLTLQRRQADAFACASAVARHDIKLEIGRQCARLWDPDLACRPLRPKGIELRLADV